MKTQNKYLNNKRLKILKLAKLIIAEEGLNLNTFETIALKHNLNINEINLLFPDGNKDLLEYSLEQLNIELQEYCKSIDLIRLPLHKRIRKILLSKIEIMNKEKNFYKKIFLKSLLPTKTIFLSKQLYKSIDQIWYLAGDTSVDFNFYTKRLILAGIYSRVVLFFFNNNNQNELENLLDLNLKRVAKIPELKSKINIFREYLPKLIKFVKNAN
tara:strand:+ start:221 stop:859 length:639 start_codon:yes stop_codon:yes gene_type:complete